MMSTSAEASPTSSPPTPPSPLPVSIGPGYQKYLITPSPSPSPPFSPHSGSPHSSDYQTKLTSSPSQTYQNINDPPAHEYSPLLPQYFAPPEMPFSGSTPHEYTPSPTQRRCPIPIFLRECLARICCCCAIEDCCPLLFGR